MNPQQLPLEPLIPPPPISWWPLAPIWWILLIVIVLLVLIISSRYFFWKKNASPKAIIATKNQMDKMRQAALDVLMSLPKPYEQAAGKWLQQINDLLKRICNSRYPSANSKVLIGRTWLKFLDSKCPAAHINQFTVLVDGEYQANFYLDKATIDALYSSVEHWITYHA